MRQMEWMDSLLPVITAASCANSKVKVDFDKNFVNYMLTRISQGIHTKTLVSVTKMKKILHERTINKNCKRYTLLIL